MKKTNKNWSLKEVLKEELILFILLTLFLFGVIRASVNYGLSYYANLNKDHPLYTYNYSIGYLEIFLIIPAAILSLFITILIDTYKKSRNRSANANLKHELDDSPQQIVFAKMEETTELNNQSNSNGSNILIKLGKVILRVWLFILVFSFKISYALVNTISKSIGNSVERTMTRWISNIERSLVSHNSKKDLIDKAYWDARQKQNEADYAWKQAAEQGNYNSNTHYFDEKLNKAERHQHEADEAKRRARK